MSSNRSFPRKRESRANWRGYYVILLGPRFRGDERNVAELEWR